MLKLMKDRTSIIIAHRLRITRFVDRVVVIKDGWQNCGGRALQDSTREERAFPQALRLPG